MNATLTAVREVHTTAGPCTNADRALDLLVREPTSLIVLGRRLALRRLDALHRLPVPRPRGCGT